jgi:hypothetical protein
MSGINQEIEKYARVLVPQRAGVAPDQLPLIVNR